MGVSRMTGITIQSWEDTDDPSQDGLYVAAGENGAQWAGFLYLCKGGDIHSLLLSTTPIFDSAEKAEESIRKVVTEIRALDPL